ncbi:MAG: MarR family transcriptional regulator [Nitrosopumilaceae archaeon]|nr:MarR family transcriptional regulator [Nitrosopumilaceae archaeon]NIU02638.1 MarR family transcriptional regulator [Nitrosopumilaceae archaeon]NIU89101.1 MarR family transcriptional regulator [Nitrosopumilaceae archaeon]NIV67204.1 MarR family transcriptional regulator [Nitrosopumilaceae archaeon]NIX63239.1 MarR family transcriptional regulator [Nitrosopumilaceae archaeon]
MGGAKKKSPAQQEKSQETKTSESKKKRSEKDGGGSKAEIIVTLNDSQAAKVLKGTKAITVSELAKQTGVKLSAANKYLVNAAKEGKVKYVAGHSGHRVYQPVSS